MKPQSLRSLWKNIKLVIHIWDNFWETRVCYIVRNGNQSLCNHLCKLRSYTKRQRVTAARYMSKSLFSQLLQNPTTHSFNSVVLIVWHINEWMPKDWQAASWLITASPNPAANLWVSPRHPVSPAATREGSLYFACDGRGVPRGTNLARYKQRPRRFRTSKKK